MLYARTPTTKEAHDRRNALLLLVYRRDRPHLYAKLLAELEPAARAALEATVDRLEAEEGGRS
jgi:hypothetical protein